MKQRSQAVVIGVLISLLASCAGQPRLVENEDRTVIYNAYSIAPQVDWTAVRVDNNDVWTIDGPKLEYLRFMTAEDGDPIFAVSNEEKQKNMPVYRSGMTAIEIRRELENGLQVLGYHQVKAVDFHPAPFGTLSGYRLTFTAVSESGLNYRGLLVGAKTDDTLHLILYMGADLYYFDKHLPTVEKLLTSIQVL